MSGRPDLEVPVQVIGRERPGSDIRLERPARSHFGPWLALVATGAFGFRVLVLALSHGERLTGDGWEWSRQGNFNAAGHWFVSGFNGRSPDALRPPLWALVLTVWAWLGQHTWLRQQVLACAIGTATVVVIGLVARRLAGNRAGLVAAGIAAVYPGLWVYERALLSEVILLLEIAVMLLLVYHFHSKPSAGGSAVLGAMCGLLALTRSEQIALVPLLVIPLIVAVKDVDWRRRVRWIALALVTLLVVVAPWTLFNLPRFQRPVLLSNGFGSAAATGNCNLTYYGPEIGYGDLRCIPVYVKGDQSVRDGEDAHIALNYADHHLSRVPLVLFAREGRAFGFWNPFQEATFFANFMGTWVGVTRIGIVSYWLLLVPAAAGGVVLRRRRVAIYPLLAFIATAVLAVAPTIGDIRYRAAAEVPLVLLAAVAIDAMLRHVVGSSKSTGADGSTSGGEDPSRPTGAGPEVAMSER